MPLEAPNKNWYESYIKQSDRKLNNSNQGILEQFSTQSFKKMPINFNHIDYKNNDEIYNSRTERAKVSRTSENHSRSQEPLLNYHISVKEMVETQTNSARLKKSSLKYIPNDNLLHILKWEKVKAKDSIFDVIIKNAKTKIGPEKYSRQSNWAVDLSNKILQGSNTKGKKFHTDRVYVTDEHIKAEKKKSVPPPGQYDILKPARILLGKLDKSEKRPEFIDEALSHSMELPSCQKYDQLNAWKKTQKRIFIYKI